MIGSGGTRRVGRRIAGARGTAVPEAALDAVTVQLLPHLLAEATLPRLAHGDILEVAPAIYAGRLEAARGRDRRVDRWESDELGTLEAVGSMLAARLDPAGCGCWVDVLDVAGRLVPLNPAAAILADLEAGGDGHPRDHGLLGPRDVPAPPDAPAGERVRVEGAVYLDPELGPGTAHGAAVALCRRRYRVAALRRYRRTPSVPVDPRPIEAAPAPGAVSHDAVYVADLVAVEPAGLTPRA